MPSPRATLNATSAQTSPRRWPILNAWQHAQQLIREIRTEQRGRTEWIVRRRNLNQIAADDVEPMRAADDFKRLRHSQPGDLRRARTRRERRIDTVDIERDVHG